MKIFVYAMREFDEKLLFDQLADEFDASYSYTIDYPSIENAYLAEGCDALIVNPCDLSNQ